MPAMPAGHQVDFGSDVTTIRIKVISPYGRATNIYTIVGLVSKYDANGDGEIDKNELLGTVGDYIDGRIPRNDTLAVVQLYFSSQFN